jgi:phage host-nuclease inhibitor protein Gam/Skp family chaperone for outer membrane proteins
VSKSKFLIMMIAFMMLVAGCSTKQQVQEPKAPEKPLVGVIDINKAAKAHPKYNQLQSLQQDANTLEAQVQAEQTAAAQRNQATLPLSDTSQGDMAELNKAFQQQFTDKMSVKEKEVNAKLAAKENSIHQTLSDEFKTYTDQVDKEYQPQIFNLQLKLKTVQLTKEDADSLQEELGKLQTEQADKMAAKQKELAAKMDEMLAPDKTAAQQELEAYSKQVNEEISKQAAAKQAEIAVRSSQQLSAPSAALQGQATDGSKEQQLAMKQQEIQALQDSIIENIRDKTSKIAIERGLEAVLTNVTVNASAVDITDAVIAECNK